MVHCTYLLDFLKKRYDYEIQGRGTALLLLMNPLIPHQKNGTMLPQLYQLVKYPRCFVATYSTLQSQALLSKVVLI